MASIKLTINGKHTTAQIAAHTTLLNWLRDHRSEERRVGKEC